MISHCYIYCCSNIKLQRCTSYRIVTVRISSTEPGFRQFVCVCLSAFSGRKIKKNHLDAPNIYICIYIYVYLFIYLCFSFSVHHSIHKFFESVGKHTLCANMVSCHLIFYVFYLGFSVYAASNNGLVSEWSTVNQYLGASVKGLEETEIPTQGRQFRDGILKPDSPSCDSRILSR